MIFDTQLDAFSYLLSDIDLSFGTECRLAKVDQKARSGSGWSSDRITDPTCERTSTSSLDDSSESNV